MNIPLTRAWQALRLGELWKYRQLLAFLIWRDVIVRYKQTRRGIAWALILPFVPFVTMLVFALFFGNLAEIASDGIPYPIFCYAGLLPGQLFLLACSRTANSLASSANLLRVVYFPRLTIFVASILASLVDVGLLLLMLPGLLAYYRILPTLAILLLPICMLLALVAVTGFGLWLAALTVRYHTLKPVVPVLIMLWIVATPVVYSSSLLPEPWRTLSGLNPMAGIIEGFRWALLGTQPHGTMIITSFIAAILVLISGLMYFRQVEQTFVDGIAILSDL